MIKVLIATPTQGAYGGIEAFVLELARYLHEHPNFDVRICLKLVQNFAMQSSLQDILDNSSLHYQVVDRASRDLRSAISWADLVHAQNASPDIALCARLCGAKLVQTIHNHLLGRSFLRTLSWRFGAGLAHWRLYNSQFVRNSWESQPNSRSEVVPTVSHLAQNFAPIAPRRGFVFVSRLIPNKGTKVLINAYQAAGINHTDWPLRIVGDGPLRGELETLSRKAGANVDFLGFVSEAEKQTVIRQARWLIAPPHTQEDMGLTPLEARANGIPVIASRDGGLPESAGDHALLCDPGDVDSLRRQIELAATINYAEYEQISRAGFVSLDAHLKPLSYYPELYQRLLK